MNRLPDAKQSAMCKAYPDEARSDAVKAMPRCRCGLLLPCSDCLPTNAVAFADQRMYRRPSMVGPDDR